MLGAGIRLGEAIASQLPAPGADAANRLSGRLGDLENRLNSLELGVPSSSAGAHEAAASATTVSAPASREHLREELRDWMEDSLTVRMAEVESRLRTESERGQRELLDAFTDSVQTRVIHRISRLEDEVAGQSSAMNELRECSLRTELSVQKLLGALEGMIVKTVPVAEGEPEGQTGEPGATAAADAARPDEKLKSDEKLKPNEKLEEEERTELLPETPSGVEPPPSLERSPKPRRWRLFR